MTKIAKNSSIANSQDTFWFSPPNKPICPFDQCVPAKFDEDGFCENCCGYVINPHKNPV